MKPNAISHLFTLATQAHQRGQLEQAAVLYRQILAHLPHHPEANQQSRAK